jgi:hypothetical protein
LRAEDRDEYSQSDSDYDRRDSQDGNRDQQDRWHLPKRFDDGCEVTVWDEDRECGISGELKQYGSDDVSVDQVCAFHDALTESPGMTEIVIDLGSSRPRTPHITADVLQPRLEPFPTRIRRLDVFHESGSPVSQGRATERAEVRGIPLRGIPRWM